MAAGLGQGYRPGIQIRPRIGLWRVTDHVQLGDWIRCYDCICDAKAQIEYAQNQRPENNVIFGMDMIGELPIILITDWFGPPRVTPYRLGGTAGQGAHLRGRLRTLSLQLAAEGAQPHAHDPPTSEELNFHLLTES